MGFSSDENHIYLNLTKKNICSIRINKCWPVAIGSTRYPTPYKPGPHYILTHYKKGFNWINPLNGRFYRAGTHSLGNIWIDIMKNENGWNIGIHETPISPSLVPLHKQHSHGCIRMKENDIKELSNNIQYLDKIFIVR